MADRSVVLNKGHTGQAGSPLDRYNTPDAGCVAGLTGTPSMNFLVGANAARTLVKVILV